MNFDTVVNAIVKSYITVYGAEKWNNLTEKEQHDAIMIIAKDFKKALDNFTL